MSEIKRQVKEMQYNCVGIAVSILVGLAVIQAVNPEAIREVAIIFIVLLTFYVGLTFGFMGAYKIVKEEQERFKGFR